MGLCSRCSCAIANHAASLCGARDGDSWLNKLPFVRAAQSSLWSIANWAEPALGPSSARSGRNDAFVFFFLTAQALLRPASMESANGRPPFVFCLPGTNATTRKSSADESELDQLRRYVQRAQPFANDA